MLSKVLIGSLLMFTALTLNCLPEQFLDLKMNNCRSCEEVEFSVPGGLHSLCKCQPGHLFVLKEGKCLSKNQISKIFKQRPENQKEKTLLNRKHNIRNLNQVFTIKNNPVETGKTTDPKAAMISSPKKQQKTTANQLKKPEIQPEQIQNDANKLLVRTTTSDPVISKPAEIKINEKMIHLQPENHTQENIRKTN